MGWLLPLVSSVISSDVQDTVKTAKRSAVFYALIAVLALTAYTFAMMAGFFKLAETRGNLDAALILAVGTVVVIGILCAALSIVSTIQRRRAARRHAAFQSQLAVAMSALPLVLRSKPLLIAAALGAVVLLGSGREKPNAD